MKVKLAAFAIVLLLSGCGSIYSAYYDIPLIGVERSGALRTGNYETGTSVGKKFTVSYLVDDKFSTIIYTFLYSFEILMLNRGRQPIRVIWDDCRYVDEKGLEHRTIHSGTDYADRFEPQPPSTIAPRDSLKTEIYPADYVVRLEKNRWYTRNLIPTMDIDRHKLESMSSELTGKKIRLILVLEIEGAIEKYDCIFQIRDSRVELYKKGLYMWDSQVRRVEYEGG